MSSGEDDAVNRVFHGVALVPSFIAMASRYGVSFDEMYKSSGADIFADISLAELDKLLCLFKKHSKNPCFFLELGEQLSFESLGIIGKVLATTQSTRHGIHQFNEFRKLIHPFAYFEISDQKNSSLIFYKGESSCQISQEQRYQEVFLSALLKLSQAIHGDFFMPISVSFTFERPAYFQQYHKIFGRSIHFSQPSCFLEIDTDLLDLPIRAASLVFNQTFAKRAQDMMLRMPDGNSLSTEVVQVIERKIGYEIFSMADIANELGLTQRTMQRRLKKENTSYAELRDRVRFRRAEEYLRDPNLDMATIAANLGFSEPANFYSAFKRWQGMSPGEYRRHFLP